MRNFALIVLLPFFAYSQEEDIKKVLETQVQCWNSGNLECYMEGYWQSDELVFVGSNGTRFGWQVTLNNYKKSYPSREAMGTLKFDILTIKSLGKKNYLVLGKWVLKREKDTPQGHFSLIFEKINGEWKIIVDHTS